MKERMFLKRCMLAALQVLTVFEILWGVPAPVNAASSDGAFISIIDISIDGRHFPDEKFRTYVSEHFDTNNDNMLSFGELSQIISISCDGMGIKSLDGIEEFGCLELLSCSDNEITGIDVSKNTVLTEFNCGNNQLSSLDVSNNKKLKVLKCYQNQLKSLDLRTNTELENVACSKNEITELDVSADINLKLLSCHTNKLKALDLSSNKKLEWISCAGNQISTLFLSNCENLKEIDCSGNEMTYLYVSNNKLLTSLYCYNNYFNSVDVKNLDLDHLNYYTENSLNKYGISLDKVNKIMRFDKTKADFMTTEQSNTQQQVTTERVTEQTTTQRATEQATTQRVTEQATTQRATEQATTQRATEQATTQRVTEQATTQCATEQATTQRATEQATTQWRTEQVTAWWTTEQATTQWRTEQVTAWWTTEQATTQPPTEQATAWWTTEQATTQRVAEQAITWWTTEQATTQPPTEHAIARWTTEQVTTQQKTEQAISQTQERQRQYNPLMSVSNSFRKVYKKGAKFKVRAWASSDGKIVFSSSNKKVAKVSSGRTVEKKGGTGVECFATVTIKGYGKTVLKVRVKETKKFKSREKTVNVTVVPDRVKVTKRAIKGDMLQYEWKKLPAVTGYQVWYSKDPVEMIGGEKFTTKGTKAELDTMKFKSGIYYYLKIRAFKKVKGMNYYGKWSAIQRIRTKGTTDD